MGIRFESVHEPGKTGGWGIPGTTYANAVDDRTLRLVGGLSATHPTYRPNDFSDDAVDNPGRPVYPYAPKGEASQGQLFQESPGHTDMLAVHPRYQRQGIAAGLLGVIENRVGRVGMHSGNDGTPVQLSGDLSPDAHQFYGSQGIDTYDVEESDSTGSTAEDRQGWAQDSLAGYHKHFRQQSVRSIRPESPASRRGQVNPVQFAPSVPSGKQLSFDGM